jgi:hypothetical protein
MTAGFLPVQALAKRRFRALHFLTGWFDSPWTARAGHHAKDASLGGGFVKHDVSHDVFAIHKHLQVLLTITSSSISSRRIF